MKTLALTFIILTVINFVGFVECKDWKKDEKHWLIALVASMLGVLIMYIKLNTWLRNW